MRLLAIFVLSLFPLCSCGKADPENAETSSANQTPSQFSWSAEIYRTGSTKQSLNIDIGLSNEDDIAEIVVDGQTQRIHQRRINLLHLNSSRDLGPERASTISITVPHQITEDFPEVNFRFPGSYDLSFKAQVTVRNDESTVLWMLPDFNTCSGEPLNAQCTGSDLMSFGHDVNGLFRQMEDEDSLLVIIGDKETYFELPPIGEEVAFATEMFVENRPNYPGHGISQRRAWNQIQEYFQLENVEPSQVFFGGAYERTGRRFFIGEKDKPLE